MLFCWLGGRRFSRKCKYSVKCIKCRMEIIRKKKNALVRHLKKVVVDLISIGHETDAFGRMDALIIEINQSSCYDMIEQHCCCILEHLPTMRKERICPEEAVEAIATLIFAAARFSDLPELADLRKQFTKRYATNMEKYINKEFVEKMQKKSFPLDKRLQLMQDISKENSIHWDSNAFQHRISNSSALTFDEPKIQFLSSNKNAKSHQLDEQAPLNNVKTKGQNACEISKSVHERPASNGTERQRADSMNSRAAKAVNPTPPYTKLPRDFTSTNNQDKFSHIVHEGSKPNRTMNPERRRAFNLKPPYVKSTNYEMTNGANYLIKTPFSVRRTNTNSDFTVEDANLLGQIPIMLVGTFGKKYSMHDEGNDHKSPISPLSNQTEDDAKTWQ